MADKEPSDELNDANPMGMYSCSRSRSGSRSRRSGIRSHHRSRSPYGGDLGRSRIGRSSARYDEYDTYRGSSDHYRESTRDSRYVDYGRSVDQYARAPHPSQLGSSSRARSRSRSPMSNRRRHEGDRENPPAGRCIGIFGLSIYTKEQDLTNVFSRYGPIQDVQIVYDAQSGRSRGFAFVYFLSVEDAAMAKDRCNGIEIDGRKIRVDFSLTQRAHTPTPGVYMGKSHGTGGGGSSSRSSYGHRGNSYNNGGGYRSNYSQSSHSRSRYPPPHPSIPPPQDYGRRRVSRSRSTSPRKYYY